MYRLNVRINTSMVKWHQIQDSGRKTPSMGTVPDREASLDRQTTVVKE